MKGIWIGFMVLLFLTGGDAHAGEAQEALKIQHLVSAVETLKGATFLRNGGQYDARQAADHLRLKLQMAGKQIKTAEEFIRFCGTRSSLSGEPYRIRFADGTIQEVAVFLRRTLEAFPTGKP
jgi:hypothetical protein